MGLSVFLLGFGEAAQSFCSDPHWRHAPVGYDIKLDNPNARPEKLAQFDKLGTKVSVDVAHDIAMADIILSLVTADQARSATASVARFIGPQTLYVDMNSTAPGQKRAAADLLSASSAQYVDAAIMAPIQSPALSVPVLLSGAAADRGLKALSALGFSNLKMIDDNVGSASTIKMIRSVMVKGIEALTAECVIAAEAAGVRDEVLNSLGADWQDRSNYNLDRMLVHGERRAAEMEQVCATLSDLGVAPIMSQGTALLQRKIGQVGNGSAPGELSEKLESMKAITKALAA